MKSGFQSDVFKVATTDGRNMTLLEPVVYVARSGEVLSIPAGASSDGASVPRILWREIPPFGAYWRAAFLHDYLYRVSQLGKDKCDALLLEAMDACGVEKLIALAIYEGVHLGGQSSFSEDRAAQKPI